MQLQAVNGYVENGKFYPMDSILSLPKRMKAVLTITDEPEIDYGAQLLEALDEAHRQSVINGTSEMTLDEINEIIAEVRRESRGNQ